MQPKIPLSRSECISTSHSLAHELDLVPDADEQTPNDLLTLDPEGRALVLDFGLFVLINLYCPNEGSDARFSYVCAAPIDHCDGHLPSNASTF